MNSRPAIGTNGSSSGFGSGLEDVDDATFLAASRGGGGGYIFGTERGGSGSGANGAPSWQDQRDMLLAEKRRVEEASLQSTRNALSLVYESEKVGLGTAENLIHQREQLTGVEDKLDTMQSTMKQSQKHLNSMKSIFGGLKNYFSKSNDKDSKDSKDQKSSGSRLGSTLDSVREGDSLGGGASGPHPALMTRGLASSQSQYDPFNEDLDERNSSRSKSLTGGQSRSEDPFGREIDDNLEELSHGIGRLKNLAMGLGSEIEDQNSMLDRIGKKAVNTEGTIGHQNVQMKKFLGQ